jgi:anthranilate synthase/aminodeoxychorismate synthase-like glutamine amidotransferase
MLVIIDNYDSFTFNLVQYFGELQTERETKLEIKVFRNDRIGLTGLVELAPEYLVISPGPCTPKESGISLEAISYFSGKIPVLGVCLGHQCIGAVFGGKVILAPRPVHGKISSIRHNGAGLFRGLANPLVAVRYHSLVVEAATFPAQLEITATCEAEGEQLVMGLRHREHPTYGVQFHPESIFTEVGKRILANFLDLSDRKDGRHEA